MSGTIFKLTRFSSRAGVYIACKDWKIALQDKKACSDWKNYLFVCHVQFPAQGAGFCLQFPNVQDKPALYKGAASRNFVLSEPQSCTLSGKLHMTDEQIDIPRHTTLYVNRKIINFLNGTFSHPFPTASHWESAVKMIQDDRGKLVQPWKNGLDLTHGLSKVNWSWSFVIPQNIFNFYSPMSWQSCPKREEKEELANLFYVAKKAKFYRIRMIDWHRAFIGKRLRFWLPYKMLK